MSRTPTLLSEAEGNTVADVICEPVMGSAQSKTLSTCGNTMPGTGRSHRFSTEDGKLGRSGKAGSYNPGADTCGKSDNCVVPMKLSNKDGQAPSAEIVEGRRLTKGNLMQTATPRTQSRISVSPGLERVRRVARMDKNAQFTALLHHIDLNALRSAYFELKRGAAPGVDANTWEDYLGKLEENLKDLFHRIHSGKYRAKPSRRGYIPKPDGQKRLLGIASLEDKIVQQALGVVLGVIYEEDFLGFSYGFRPGRRPHDALDALVVGLKTKKVNWVLDADIKGFFDTISHDWMIRLLEHRITDPRVLRLVRKWLRAGVSEGGEWSETKVGVPQGAVISPLLANVYLHYVLDQWAIYWRAKHASGEVIIVRYADDFILGFQHRHDAEQFLGSLKRRLEEFGLSLHPDKTRLIEFGKFADENRRKRGAGKPETFDFLGFTHMCAKTRVKKWFHVWRKTVKKRLRAALSKVKLALKVRMHDEIEDVGLWLRNVITGYYQYYAIPGNFDAINTYRNEIARYWLQVLRRRGQKRRINWSRFQPIVDRWIPSPKVLHPYPEVRFFAKYPR